TTPSTVDDFTAVYCDVIYATRFRSFFACLPKPLHSLGRHPLVLRHTGLELVSSQLKSLG
ncbi:hypothetical protein, partial [Agrobacterium sp. ATCC 31749]|uniref:hypothetical protein n=1 Tax=Agrobacterium sp. ATCC 31749 TaxID=82789 RepID=UPI001AEBA68F